MLGASTNNEVQFFLRKARMNRRTRKEAQAILHARVLECEDVESLAHALLADDLLSRSSMAPFKSKLFNIVQVALSEIMEWKKVATLAEQERKVLQDRVAELEAAAFFARPCTPSPTPPAVATAAAVAAPALPPLGSPLTLKAPARRLQPRKEHVACQTIQLMEDEETQTEDGEELYCTNCEAWQMQLAESMRHCKFLESQVARMENGSRSPYDEAELEAEATAEEEEEGGAMMYERSPTPLEEEEDQQQRQQQMEPEEQEEAEMEAKYGQERESEPELELEPAGEIERCYQPGAPLSVVEEEEGSQAEDGSVARKEEEQPQDHEMKQAEEERENVLGQVTPESSVSPLAAPAEAESAPVSSPIGSISAMESPPPVLSVASLASLAVAEVVVSATAAAAAVEVAVTVEDEPVAQPPHPSWPPSRAEQKAASEVSAAIATSDPSLAFTSQHLSPSILSSPQQSTQPPLRSLSFTPSVSIQQKASEYGIQLTSAQSSSLWADVALAGPSELQRIRQEQQQQQQAQAEMKD